MCEESKCERKTKSETFDVVKTGRKRVEGKAVWIER